MLSRIAVSGRSASNWQTEPEQHGRDQGDGQRQQRGRDQLGEQVVEPGDRAREVERQHVLAPVAAEHLGRDGGDEEPTIRKMKPKKSV